MALKIENTKDKSKTFVNVIVYGSSGVGKTSLVKTLPAETTLVLSAEDGLLSVRDHGVDYVKIKSIGDVLEVINDEDCAKYKNIVVDSITELSQNHFSFLKNKYPDPKLALKLWGDFSEDFSKMFKTLRGLEKNVLALALVKETENESGKIIKKPDVYGKSSDRIIAWFDECFYMHINAQNERMLLTESVENVMAKDRSGLFDKLISPDMGEVFKKILS
jgi:phage nucleotide-binding protein